MCFSVLDDTADVVQGRFRQTAVTVTGEDVLAVFDQGLVNVHAVTVVAYERLRHEGRGLAVAVRNVLHDVFQNQHFVSLA